MRSPKHLWSGDWRSDAETSRQEAAEAALAEGRKMSFDDAVAYAMEQAGTVRTGVS